MKSIKLLLASLMLTAVFLPSAFASSGTVILAKGVVTATGADKVNRVLAKGAAVEEGDIVSTAQKSFAVIRMLDKTKLTLKPGTTIAIGKFSIEKGKEEACINLVKGGLRTVTGLIGKRKPESFQVDTPIASIGIRGTDFIVRVCEDEECLNDERALAYDNVEDPELSGGAAVASAINQQLPEGLYGSCETGAIVMSQCAEQVQDFKIGSCRTSQQKDCTNVELGAGKAGYAGLRPIAATVPSPSGGAITEIPKTPLILNRDPYFALSDLSDVELDKIDRFPESFSPQSECSIYGG